jgi:hypothetical protein
MTEVPFPSSVSVGRFSLRMICDIRHNESPFGGGDNVVDMLGDYWEASVSINWKRSRDTGELEAFLSRMSTGVCFTKFGHLARPAPHGTLTSSTGTLFPALKHSDSVTVQATNGTTLLAGDMVSVDGLLFQLAEDAVASSDQMVLFFVNRLRRDIAAFSTVDLSAPVTSFILKGNAGLKHGVNFSENLSLDFEEKVFG